MAITRPTSKTIISTTGWGFPVTDEINRLSPLVDAAKPTAWTDLVLQNGWVNMGAPRGTTAVKTVSGFGVLRIAMKSGTANLNAFVIPTFARPSYFIDTQIRSGATMGWLNIDTAGTATLFTSDTSLCAGIIVYPLT